MIAKGDSERQDVWAKLSAPLDGADISWRIDSAPKARDGKHFARFVCYVESNTIRRRLDSVVPGEWDVTLERLPEIGDDNGTPAQTFKARLQVLGVMRENVGSGKDYKQAATDAFKRAAVHFGIGAELYDYEQNWVEVDGDGKYAKPVEDPQVAYDRRYGGRKGGRGERDISGANSKAADQEEGPQAGTPPTQPPTLTDEDAVSCPKCGGRMWNNRLTKRNPKAPDFKCRDRNCDGVVWPPRGEGARGNAMDPDDYQSPPLDDEFDF